MDLRYEHLPIWHAVQQSLRSRESPFWIEGQYCGNPFLFTQEAPLFYPLTTPLLLTGEPVHRLSDLFTLFHLWLAGFAAFLLLRDRDCDSLSALFGGIAWMLSARMVQSSIWPNAVAVQAMLPLLLLGIFRLKDGHRRSAILWIAICGGLCLLLSRPQAVMGAAPLLAVAVVTVVLRSTKKLSVVRDLAIAGSLAAAIGGPAVLPSALLYSETSRAGGLQRTERDLKPLWTGGELDQVFLPTDGPRRWPEAAAYPGVFVAVLFLAGVIAAIRGTATFSRLVFWAVAAGGLVGLVFAFGESGPLRLIADLPLLRGFRIPARYLASWSLALAVAAALALSHVARRSGRPRTVAGICLVGLTLDLGIHARGAAPTAPSALYSVEPAIVPFLRDATAPDETGFSRRVLSVLGPPFLWLYEDDREKLAIARRFEPLYGAIGMRYGLEMVGGAGPSILRWKEMFQQFVPRAAEVASAGAIVLPPPGAPIPPVGSPSRLLVQRFSGLPRALLVPEAVVVPRARSIAATLGPTLDLRRTVVLEEGSPRSRDPRWRSGAASIHLVSRAPGRLKLAAVSPGDGILVVLNTFEKGWRAKVDGRAQPVLPADGAFQAVRLPAGRHTVELRYRPRGLVVGIAGAAIGVLGLVLCGFRLHPS
jgi:hypothetical protein